jgi:hypothetical protein
VIAAVGKWYNNALVIVDYTNHQTTGDRLLRDLNYPNIYQWFQADAKNQNSNRWHWVWNNKNKEDGWGVLDGWLRDHSYVIKDPLLAKELRHFQRLPDGTLGAPDSKDEDGLGDDFEKIHDDLIMASISLIIASHQRDPRRVSITVTPQAEGVRGPGTWKGSCAKCGKDFDAIAPCERDRCPFCGSVWLKWGLAQPEGALGVGKGAVLGFTWEDMAGVSGAARDRQGGSEDFSFGPGQGVDW